MTTAMTASSEKYIIIIIINTNTDAHHGIIIKADRFMSVPHVFVSNNITVDIYSIHIYMDTNV